MFPKNFSERYLPIHAGILVVFQLSIITNLNPAGIRKQICYLFYKIRLAHLPMRIMSVLIFCSFKI